VLCTLWNTLDFEGSDFMDAYVFRRNKLLTLPPSVVADTKKSGGTFGFLPNIFRGPT